MLGALGALAAGLGRAAGSGRASGVPGDQLGEPRAGRRRVEARVGAAQARALLLAPQQPQVQLLFSAAAPWKC